MYCPLFLLYQVISVTCIMTQTLGSVEQSGRDGFLALILWSENNPGCQASILPCGQVSCSFLLPRLKSDQQILSLSPATLGDNTGQPCIVSFSWLILGNRNNPTWLQIAIFFLCLRVRSGGHRERRNTALEPIRFIQQPLRAPAPKYIPVLLCLLLPRGVHPPQWLSVISMLRIPMLRKSKSLLSPQDIILTATLTSQIPYRIDGATFLMKGATFRTGCPTQQLFIDLP